MKLHSPWKALFWEEVYVGGRVVAVVWAVCAFVTVFVAITSSQFSIIWKDVDILCYVAVYLTSFLLLLQIGNTGEMQVGFPRRVLSLPVPSSVIVTVSLLSRLFLIIFLTLSLRITVSLLLLTLMPAGKLMSYPSHAGNMGSLLLVSDIDSCFFIPLIFPCLLHSFVYVTFQFLCWVFIASPLLIMLVAGLTALTGFILLVADYPAVFAILSLLIGKSPSINLSYGYRLFLSIFPFLFIVFYTWVIGLLSVKVVTNIRSQSYMKYERMLAFLRFSLTSSEADISIIKKFSKPGLAQLWFELRGNGFIVPLWTFLIWGFLSVLYTVTLLLMWYVTGTNGSLFIKQGYSNYLNVIFFICPLVAILFSGVVWYLKVTRRKKRDLKSEVFPLFHIPITAKERAYAYWLGGNISLSITLLVVGLVVFVYLYWALKTHLIPNPLLPGMDALLQHVPFLGVSDFVPGLIKFTTGVVLLVGLVVWFTMFNPSSIFVIGFIILSASGVLINIIKLVIEVGIDIYCFLMGIYPGFYISRLSFHSSFPPFLNFVFYVVYLFYIFLFVVYFYITFRRRLLGWKEQIAIISIVLAIFMLSIPWSAFKGHASLIYFGTYAFLASLFGVTWLKVLFQFHGLNWRRLLTIISGDKDTETGKEDRAEFLIAGYFLPIVFVLVLFAFNFHGGSSIRKGLTYFRENSLPATLQEMNDKYHSVPENENLAKGYYDLIPLREKIANEKFEYAGEIARRISAELNIKDEECLQDLLNDSYKTFGTKDNLLPERIYQGYKEIHDKISRNFTEELHKVAERGLNRGHYPIDLRKGYNVELPHLAVLRDYVCELGLEAVLCSIDGDYEGMLRALRTAVSIFNSLESEPILVSQLVRIAIFGKMYDYIEWIINHQELSEEVLIPLDDVVRSCSIPLEKRSVFSDALLTELLSVLSLSFISQREMFFAPDDYLYSEYGNNQITGIPRAWLSVVDICYPADIERLLSLNLFAMMRKCFNEVAKEENINLPIYNALKQYTEGQLKLEENNIFVTNPPYYFSPIFYIVYPGINRYVEVELRHHVFVNLIRTAIAIERFRLKNYRLPESLQELVPEYLQSIPKDPWRDGAPVKYVKEKDYGYKIYSIGSDREDDGGTGKDGKGGIISLLQADFVFSVAPLTARRQPDVSTDRDFFPIECP